METYFVYNGNLENQNTAMDSEDTSFIIAQPFDSNQDEPVPFETSKRTWREWSSYETKILMDMYRRNVTQVGPMKTFKSKKEMFNFIAYTISTKLDIPRNALQCENRYKTVLNQRKIGILGRPSIQKTRSSNVGKRLHEEEEYHNSATASVSADHDYNGKNSVTNSQSVLKSNSEWGVEDTKLLMDLYKKNINKVGLERTFRTKIKMFEHIAETISEIFNITRTAEQCINRYKTIFRRKSFRLNKLNHNNNLSTNNIVLEEHISSNANPNCDADFVNSINESELNTYMYDGKTLKKIVKQPKALPTLLPKEPDPNQDTVLTRTLKEIAAQKEKTLLKIAANQELAEERRHQETMALIQQLGKTLIQCIGNRQGDHPNQ